MSPNTEDDPSGGPVPCDRKASSDHHPDGTIGGKASLPPDYEDDLSELIDTAEHLAANRVAAWGAIKAEVERRIAHGQEWAPSGTEAPARAGVEHDRPGQNTGGAMPTDLGAAAQARRQHIGFDLEVATYVRLKPEMISRFPGKLVAIVGNEVEAPTRNDTRGNPRSGPAILQIRSSGKKPTEKPLVARCL
jgi:hypothetical protein